MMQDDKVLESMSPNTKEVCVGSLKKERNQLIKKMSDSMKQGSDQDKQDQ